LDEQAANAIQIPTVVEPQIVDSTEVVAGPWEVTRSTGKSTRSELEYALPYFEAYQGFDLMVENLPNASGTRVSSATVSIDGREIFGPKDFSQQVNRLVAPVTLDSDGRVVVELQSAPGSALRVSLIGHFALGYGRLTGAGGVMAAPGGGFSLTIPANQLEGSVLVQVFVSDDDLVAPSAFGPTYGVRVMSGPQPAPAEGRTPALEVSDLQLLRATVTFTADAIQDASWNWVYHTVGAAGNAVASLADASVDLARGTVASHSRLVLGLGGAAAQLYRRASEPIATCGDAYKLSAPAEPFHGDHTVIYIHGWQMDRPSCRAWDGFEVDFADTGLPGHFASDPRGLPSLVSLRSYTYPTFNPIDWAAQDLAERLMASFSVDRPVTLVAHSMGGLVARAAIEKYGAGPWVAQLITLGTPHQGSPLADWSFIDENVPSELVCVLGVQACVLETIVTASLGGVFLGTPGARDLRSLDRVPSSDPVQPFIGSLGTPPGELATHYHLLGGEIGDAPGLAPCGHGLFECASLKVLRRVLDHAGVAVSDAVVPSESAFADVTLGTVPAENRYRGLSTTHDHLELPKGDALAEDTWASPDVILSKVTDLIYEMARPKARGLLAHYPFDGDFSDATGRNAAVQPIGAGISFGLDRRGEVNKAVRLEGIGTELHIAAGITNGLPEGTINLWIRADNPTTRELCSRTDMPNVTPFYCQFNILSKGLSDDPPMRAQFGAATPGGRIDRFYFKANDDADLYPSASTTDFSGWHMYTFVWGQFGRRMYLDGVLVEQAPGAVAAPTWGDLILGANGGTLRPDRERLRGWIDEVRLYDQAVPEGELRRLCDVAWVCDPDDRLGRDQFVLVQPGSFPMGSTNGFSDEQPVHTVSITHAYYLQKTEVTQAQWRAVMGANPSYFSVCDECPVERVTWNDAQAFIAALNAAEPGANFRLPTEAEWEYAARAGTTGDFAGNGVLEDMGWYLGNSASKTHSVGLKRPNAWGLYDMHGNVWEWAQDWYSATYYAGSPAADPMGPTSGTRRVIRGGSWGNEPPFTRSAYRGSPKEPAYSTWTLGLRLARTP
jgi:pimeloyl-ACP methyl ester carboxylesterase